MKKIIISTLLICLIACQKKQPEQFKLNEFRIKKEEKLSDQKLMCVQDLCVTDEELYNERGSNLYQADDKLENQKYELTKTILIQKLIEQKISKTGQSFSDYHRKIKNSLNISDQEARDFLDKLGVKTENNSEQFADVKNHLLNVKIQDQYLKTITEEKTNQDIFVQLQKKARKEINFDYKKLIPLSVKSNDDLKITILLNPFNREQKTFFEIISSLTQYFNNENYKISWYFLPLVTESSQQMAYEKAFICSYKLDSGRSYQSLLEVSSTFESENQILEFLSSNEKNASKLKTCYEDQATINQIADLKSFAKSEKIINVTQLIFNNEPQFFIPGLIGLKTMIENRLNTKPLAKNP